MKNKLLEIIVLLHDIQATGKYTVFYAFSGHVNFFNIQIYLGKWEPNKDMIFDHQYAFNDGITTTNDGHKTTFNKIINAIKQATP